MITYPTKLMITVFAGLNLLLVANLAVEGLQAAEAKQQAGPKRHTLPATLETTQWGWLDPNESPKLTVDSGDIVSIETMMHSHNKIQPGTTIDEIVALRKANPGGGPHSVTGPIYVNGAEPGNVMEIRILRIVPKPFGVNFNLPGKEFPTIGALAPEFPEGFVKYFNFDSKNRQAEFKPGVMIDLQPFPGTLAVGIDPDDPAPRKGGAKDSMAPVSTLRPWKNGSNMDLNELQEVALQLIVRKDMKLEWPRAETKTHWILMGFDEDLNKAMVNAVRETVDFLANQKMVPLDRYEAYSLTSMTADCRVTQVVDVRKGVHCMVPKSIFAKKK